MRVLICLCVSAVMAQDLYMARPKLGDLQPCASGKYKCQKVSTRLFTRSQFIRINNGTQWSERDSSRTRGRGTSSTKGRDSSWTRLLNGRRRREHRRRRVRRSQARTVMSMSLTHHKMIKHRRKPCHKYAIFRVFGSDFTLCLMMTGFLADPILAQSSQDMTVAVYGSNEHFTTRTLKSMMLQVATGHVIGKVFSSVRGYVWRDKFYGTVFTEGDTLHVEPLVNRGPVRSKFNRITNRAVNAYVYKVYSKRRANIKKTSKRDHKAYRLYKNKKWKALKNHYRRHFGKSRMAKKLHRRNQKKQGSRIGKRSSSTQCRSCSLLLVADHTFYLGVGEHSVKQTVLHMLYHVMEANILLKTKDFDRDGAADCLGIHVAGIGVITSNSSAYNLLAGDFHSPEEYLRTFSRYKLDKYCLAVLFSNRVFQDKVLGLSWRGNPAKSSGACQRRTVSSEERLNFNSLFITLRAKSQTRIPLRMGVLNLAHEILHSFGSDHDPDTAECSPEEEKGRYLMSKFSNNGLKTNNDVISNCTAHDVSRALLSHHHTYCLHDTITDYCGDGIIGQDEACDCGTVEDCIRSKSCCVPPGSRRGDQPCQWRRDRVSLGSCRRLPPPEDHKSLDLSSHRECSRLGLSSCSCPASSSCSTCCQTLSGDRCLPSSTWTGDLFTQMQHYIARVCWRHSVWSCVTSSSRWTRLLAHLTEHHDKDPASTDTSIYCLQSSVDQNCWELDFRCIQDDNQVEEEGVSEVEGNSVNYYSDGYRSGGYSRTKPTDRNKIATNFKHSWDAVP